VFTTLDRGSAAAQTEEAARLKLDNRLLPDVRFTDLDADPGLGSAVGCARQSTNLCAQLRILGSLLVRYLVDSGRDQRAERLVKVEFFELAVLPPDDTNRACYRAHYNGFSLDEMPTKFDAGHQSAGGDAGGGKQAIAPHHILD
jgi:hypothetical protein